MTIYAVSYSAGAQDDLHRLFEFLADADVDAAERALVAIDSAIQAISRHPYICRPAANGELGRYWRELLISFGSSGYVALFEIHPDDSLTIMAVKHQRESDYH